MKRCPQCNRVETDETLKFCRVDGVTLVNDSSPIDKEAGTVRLSSGSISSEATAALTDSTNAHFDRATGPTTVLPSQAASSTTNNLRIATKRRLSPKALVIGTAIVAAVTAIGVISYRVRSSSAALQSIAVMPFVNESGNMDVEYLSDGITETLIRSLSQLPNLSVKSRSTVFTYKGKQTTPKSIGEELGVQAVLLGRVIQRGEALSLNLELVNTQTQDVIWTDEYNRRSSDLISLQNEIARDVSSKLRLKLSEVDQQKLAKSFTNNPEVYKLYLQGRFYWNKRAGPEFQKAEGYFRQAVEKDPNFALGYVGLADFTSDRDKAKEYVNRALQLDPDLPEAVGTLGYQYMLDYDWVNAERYMKRSLELDQKNPDVHRWNGQRLMMLGRLDEAFAAYDRAFEIDPGSSNVRLSYGACLIVSGKLNEGIRYLEDSVKADPTFVWLHSFLGRAYGMRNDWASSVEQRAIARELNGEPENARLLRESFAKGGRDGFLRELIRLRESQSQPAVGSQAAELYALLGENDKALQILERAAERKGDFWLFLIKHESAYDPFRGDPRFQTLLEIFDVPK